MTNLIKKLLLITTIISTMFISGCGEVQLGYVDRDKIMDTPQIKTIIDEAETKLQEAQTQVVADLEAKKDAPDEEKQKAQMEAQRKLIGIQQAYTSQVKQKLDAALADIVKSKNIDVVIYNPSDDNSVEEKVVFEGGIDLTGEVVQKLQ